MFYICRYFNFLWIIEFMHRCCRHSETHGFYFQHILHNSSVYLYIVARCMFAHCCGTSLENNTRLVGRWLQDTCPDVLTILFTNLHRCNCTCTYIWFTLSWLCEWVPSFLQLNTIVLIIVQVCAFNDENTSGGGDEVSRAITDTDVLLWEMGAVVIKH